MSGIMMASIASYPSVSSGSIQFGTNPSYALTTGIPAPGTDACTYECWVYFLSVTQSFGENVIFNTFVNGVIGASANGVAFTGYGPTNQYILYGPTAYVFFAQPLVLNTWNHVAITIASGGAGASVKFWLNGSSITFSSGGTLVAPTLSNTDLAIGGRGYKSLNGYISNFRYVKGVEVYTGNFTVPTSPLTATQSAGTNISAITAGQTQLLLNAASSGTLLTDSSSYARTVTSTGTVTYNSLNPFS